MIMGFVVNDYGFLQRFLKIYIWSIPDYACVRSTNFCAKRKFLYPLVHCMLHMLNTIEQKLEARGSIEEIKKNKNKKEHFFVEISGQLFFEVK